MFSKITILQSTSLTVLCHYCPNLSIHHRWCLVVWPTLGQQQLNNGWLNDWLIDWLIDYMVLYAESAIFRPYNGPLNGWLLSGMYLYVNYTCTRGPRWIRWYSVCIAFSRSGFNPVINKGFIMPAYTDMRLQCLRSHPKKRPIQSFYATSRGYHGPSVTRVPIGNAAAGHNYRSVFLWDGDAFPNFRIFVKIDRFLRSFKKWTKSIVVFLNLDVNYLKWLKYNHTKYINLSDTYENRNLDWLNKTSAG